MFNLVWGGRGVGGCGLDDREITFTIKQGLYGRFDYVPARIYLI